MLVLFNKPYGVLSQFSPEANHPALKDYIPIKGVYPAGRLDRDSEGLLLLTDDGKLQHRISDPRHKLAKTYWVQVEGDVSPQALQQLTRGVELNDGMTLPAQAHSLTTPTIIWPRDPPIRVRLSVPDAWLSLTIREGRNRQVRRMTAAVGLPTLRLIRWQIGEWTVEGLRPGEYRVIEKPLL
ncbi:MAG: pseudouridine synthase [Pseudomonadota bacterium]